MKASFNNIMTNEWYSPVLKSPIVGRDVLCVFRKKIQRTGNYEYRHGVAVWNGVYWVDGNRVRINHKAAGDIVAWYMFEKYNPNDNIEF